MTGTVPTRNLRIDVLKLLCAQAIVLHHFSAYGPLSDVLERDAPMVSAWLFDYGRIAVQVFLVLGGYLAARSLDRSRQGHPISLVAVVWKRYQRLILPLMAALALVTVAAAWARPWLRDEFVPMPPGWWQVLVHALLLQDLLGQDALSVGVWYVAIDFQLYVLMALIFWGRQLLPQRQLAAEAVVVALMLASLLVANRDPDLDRWALYFFGAYGMGAVASWAQRSRHRNAILLSLCLVVALAMVLDFRGRLVLALVTALLLGTMPAVGMSLPSWLQRWVVRLGRSSYGLFLVHFSVLLFINVVFAHWAMQGLAALYAMLALGVLLSTLLGLAFARYVEAPLSRLLDGRKLQ
jgi:peptidoglycan/LPS O-acetylase OafA/YrhL